MHVRRPAAGDPRSGREHPPSKLGSDYLQPSYKLCRGTCCANKNRPMPTYGSIELQLPVYVSSGRLPVFGAARPRWASICVSDPIGQVIREPIYPGSMQAEHGTLVWGIEEFISAPAESYLNCHLQLRCRMQVRDGRPCIILHCNHAGCWTADWWTTLQALHWQTDYRSRQMNTRS